MHATERRYRVWGVMWGVSEREPQGELFVPAEPTPETRGEIARQQQQVYRTWLRARWLRSVSQEEDERGKHLNARLFYRRLERQAVARLNVLARAWDVAPQ